MAAGDSHDAEEVKEIAQAAREEKMTYPCFLDKDSAWQKQVGTEGSVPYFLVIGKSGRIVFKHKGILEESSPAFTELAAAIERTIAASS